MAETRKIRGQISKILGINNDPTRWIIADSAHPLYLINYNPSQDVSAFSPGELLLNGLIVDIEAFRVVRQTFPAKQEVESQEIDKQHITTNTNQYIDIRGAIVQKWIEGVMFSIWKYKGKTFISTRKKINMLESNSVTSPKRILYRDLYNELAAQYDLPSLLSAKNTSLEFVMTVPEILIISRKPNPDREVVYLGKHILRPRWFDGPIFDLRAPKFIPVFTNGRLQNIEHFLVDGYYENPNAKDYRMLGGETITVYLRGQMFLVRGSPAAWRQMFIGFEGVRHFEVRQRVFDALRDASLNLTINANNAYFAQKYMLLDTGNHTVEALTNIIRKRRVWNAFVNIGELDTYEKKKRVILANLLFAVPIGQSDEALAAYLEYDEMMRVVIEWFTKAFVDKFNPENLPGGLHNAYLGVREKVTQGVSIEDAINDIIGATLGRFYRTISRGFANIQTTI